jgi:hypothetical protein
MRPPHAIRADRSSESKIRFQRDRLVNRMFRLDGAAMKKRPSKGADDNHQLEGATQQTTRGVQVPHSPYPLFRRITVYLTARSYLLAGFTAASIVATIPFAPRSTVHMPDIHAADVQLAAAESKIAATVRTLHAVEARAVASTVEGATTTVLPDLTRRSTAATIKQPVPSAAPAATTHQPAQQASTAAPTVTTPQSAVDPVAGDLLALTFDLAGTPAVVINNLSFVADAAIATLTGATAGAVPSDLALAQRLNHISADLTNLTDAIRHLVFQSNAGESGTDTQSGVNTGSVAASNSATLAPAAKGAPDLSALGPLVGDVAITGVDMVASPFAITQTLTRALAVEVTDIGAGQMQAGQQAANTILRNGAMQLQTRITNDEKDIGAALARLMGKPSTTIGQVSTANSAAAAQAVSTPAVPKHPTKLGPGPVLPKSTSSTSTAKVVGTEHNPGAVHTPTTAGPATATSATSSKLGSSHTPGTTATPTRQGSDSTGTTKPSSPSSKAGGQSPTKGGGANSTSTAKHSAPAKSHEDGGKHRKH